MSQYGANFISLKIEGIKGKGWRSLKSLLFLPFFFLESLALLVRLRPDLVIGAGGYSSGPVVLLASLTRIPTLIMEQNVLPGVTNRLLARWATKVVVAFKSSLPRFKGKGIFLGNPVREEFYSLPPKEKTEELVLLVFGGSQGSHFLNKAMLSALPLLENEKGKLRIFHQTGKAEREDVRLGYEQNGFEDVVIDHYFPDMANYFRQSDLVISRAGATTIAELIAARKASILIPFAKASENHQLWNARELEAVQAAEVITEDEFKPQLLAAKIRFYLAHKEKIGQMEKNLEPLRTARAAERIVDLCQELMKAKT
jgi:UDP-N-acetylglucosamine--N-acetylmuramyl-(pentapeptide) pyrophosphoryl-undecaprenol N-acetylglucosamine transferase